MLHCSPEERPLDAPQGRRVQDDDAEHDEALKLKVKFDSVFCPKKCCTLNTHRKSNSWTVISHVQVAAWPNG